MEDYQAEDLGSGLSPVVEYDARLVIYRALETTVDELLSALLAKPPSSLAKQQYFQLRIAQLQAQLAQRDGGVGVPLVGQVQALLDQTVTMQQARDRQQPLDQVTERLAMIAADLKVAVRERLTHEDSGHRGVDALQLIGVSDMKEPGKSLLKDEPPVSR